MSAGGGGPFAARARVVGLVARKELRETLRDRRTIAMMVGFPLVIYPLLALLGTQVLTARQARLEEQPARVGLAAVPGAEAEAELVELARALDKDVRRLVAQAPARFVLVPAARRADLRAGRIDVFAQVVSPDGPARAPRVQLDYDSAREPSGRAQARLADALSALLPPGCAQRYQVISADQASADERGGHLLARVLPLLVVVMLMLGALYPAIDTTAGERERGTLETTLAAPIARVDLLLGKVLAVACIASVTGLANLLSMALTSVQVVALAAPELAPPIPWPRLALAALGVLPSALLFSALMVAVACTARSFKEAQNLVTPVYVLFLVPSVIAALGEVELGPLSALVPGVNLTLLLRALIGGKAAALPFALGLCATVAYAALALRLAAHLFDPERLLAASTARSVVRPAPSGRARADLRAEGLSPGEAMLAFVLAFLVFFLSLPVQARWPTPGLLGAQWLGMAALSVGLVRARGLSPGRALGLHPVAPRVLVGAALCGLGAWVVVAMLVERVLAPPPEVLEQLRHALLAQGERPLWLTLLLVALTPAVCEELLFRGVILRGLARGLPAAAALAISAALFALFHLNAYRLLPTFLLGLGLGWLALRSGSTLPGMLAHLCNNAVIILISAVTGDAELGQLSPGLQVGCGAASLVLLGLGAALVVRGSSGAPPGAAEDRRVTSR